MIVAVTFALSVLLCGLYLKLAQRWQIVDRPNERSSHERPTPHGGGIGLIVAFSLGLLLAAMQEGSWPSTYYLLAMGAQVLMVLGVVDDITDLSRGLRFAIYGVLCFMVAIVLGPPAFATQGVLAWFAIACAAFAMLWLLNLYNFMDGIDGLAGLQAVVAAGGAGVLCLVLGDDARYALFCLLLAAAHLGFLYWNRPPARLFMGDAGSVPTGFLLAALALYGHIQGYLTGYAWLILLAVFITDATWTLVWRMLKGQPFTRPHRLHAYQRLSRHWGSHGRVDALFLGLAVCWLLPLAAMAALWPEWGLFLVILAYLPLLPGMAVAGRFA